MTRVAELEAALRDALDLGPLHSYTPEQSARLDAARAALDPARKIVDEGMEQDARRYRWLRADTSPTNRWPHIAQYPRQQQDKERVPQVWDRHGYHPHKLDAAIDELIARADSARQGD